MYVEFLLRGCVAHELGRCQLAGDRGSRKTGGRDILENIVLLAEAVTIRAETKPRNGHGRASGVTALPGNNGSYSNAVSWPTSRRRAGLSDDTPQVSSARYAASCESRRPRALKTRGWRILRVADNPLRAAVGGCNGVYQYPTAR
jgi:hypothetical protein